MSARKTTWTDRLTSWWKTPLPKVQAKPSFASRTKKIEACLEDPDSALAELQQEQRMISHELEQTFLAYDRRLRTVAERLAGRGKSKEQSTPTGSELERLRTEQVELWKLVRRAQAASRSTRQLERELREWQQHPTDAAPVGHPDHPETRMEIVRSELRIRGVERPIVDHIQPPKVNEPLEERASSMIHHAEHQIPSDNESRFVTMDIGPQWAHDSDEHMMRELISREREMAKLLTVPQGPEVIAELASMAHELRQLHSHLRSHDRRERIKRVRWELGIPA